MYTCPLYTESLSNKVLEYYNEDDVYIIYLFIIVRCLHFIYLFIIVELHVLKLYFFTRFYYLHLYLYIHLIFIFYILFLYNSSYCFY